MNNKKVLLREHKGHTARRVASARYWGGGTPSSHGWGYPPNHPDLAGVPPPTTIQTWSRGVPQVPPSPSRPGWSYPPPPIQTWLGYPPSPVEVWTDKQTENSTFPHPSDAGGKNPFLQNEHWTGLTSSLIYHRIHLAWHEGMESPRKSFKTNISLIKSNKFSCAAKKAEEKCFFLCGSSFDPWCLSNFRNKSKEERLKGQSITSPRGIKPRVVNQESIINFDGFFYTNHYTADLFLARLESA